MEIARSRRPGRRGLLLALVAAALAIAPAAAASPVASGTAALPDDVAAFFAEEASGALAAGGLPGAPGSVHEVFTWSEAYLTGAAGEPTVSIEEWIAPVERGGQPTGTLTAWRPAPGEAATFAATSDDAELAQALLTLPAGAQLVHDPPVDAWFAIADGLASPLNGPAAADLPDGPAPLDELQRTVVERTASQRAGSDDASAPIGGGAPGAAAPWLLGAGIVAAVVALLAGIGIAVRMRRPRRGH